MTASQTDVGKIFDILVENLGLGFDCQFTVPVPQWFLDELAAAWARFDPTGTIEEYAEGLTMEGWSAE